MCGQLMVFDFDTMFSIKLYIFVNFGGSFVLFVFLLIHDIERDPMKRSNEVQLNIFNVFGE